jgi:hypothetical protein
LKADIESEMEIFVPHITRVESPPSASASEVSGFRFEKVASEPGSPTGMPSSPTNIRRRCAGVDANASECMSPRRVDILGVIEKLLGWPD